MAAGSRLLPEGFVGSFMVMIKWLKLEEIFHPAYTVVV